MNNKEAGLQMEQALANLEVILKTRIDLINRTCARFRDLAHWALLGHQDGIIGLQHRMIFELWLQGRSAEEILIRCDFLESQKAADAVIKEVFKRLCDRCEDSFGSLVGGEEIIWERLYRVVNLLAKRVHGDLDSLHGTISSKHSYEYGKYRRVIALSRSEIESDGCPPEKETIQELTRFGVHKKLHAFLVRFRFTGRHKALYDTRSSRVPVIHQDIRGYLLTIIRYTLLCQDDLVKGYRDWTVVSLQMNGLNIAEISLALTPERSRRVPACSISDVHQILGEAKNRVIEKLGVQACQDLKAFMARVSELGPKMRTEYYSTHTDGVDGLDANQAAAVRWYRKRLELKREKLLKPRPQKSKLTQWQRDMQRCKEDPVFAAMFRAKRNKVTKAWKKRQKADPTTRDALIEKEREYAKRYQEKKRKKRTEEGS